MTSTESPRVDFVRELRLRQWAVKNFVPKESRSATWHPIVLDEMVRLDQQFEQIATTESSTNESLLQQEVNSSSLEPQTLGYPEEHFADQSDCRYVPLMPDALWRLDSADSGIPKPHLSRSYLTSRNQTTTYSSHLD